MATRLLHPAWLLILALYSAGARAEYRSEGIGEAQGFSKVSAEKPPISPEVMNAVVAKVRANPQLTQALIQANPRFKKILGIQDGEVPTPAVRAAAPAPQAPVVTMATGYAGTPRTITDNGNGTGQPSAEKVRLAETLSQVRAVMAGGGGKADYATAERELASLPSESNLGVPPAAAPLDFNRQPTARGAGGRLLGSLGNDLDRREVAAQNLEYKKKSLIAKEKRFARYTNASGGAGLQASLEFNRRVRGAVAAPGDNYQLAMRDISEYGGDDNVPLLKPKRVIRDGAYDTRPVGGRRYNPLLRHTYDSMMITEKGGHGGGTDNRHKFTDSVIKDGGAPSANAKP